MSMLTKLLGYTETEPNVLTLGGLPVPKELEPLHFLFAASTGTGKSTLIKEMMTYLIPRGDSIIVLDPNGDYLSKYAKPGDVLLNPFDKRSQGWSIFNEVRKDYDYDRLARSVIPDASGSDAAWHSYGQVFISEVMRAAMLRGEGDTFSLVRWATTATVDELRELLAGTAAQGLLDKDASRALASTRYIVTSHLQPHKYLRAGEFSLRNWVVNQPGNLYITWRNDMRSALQPLLATWADILISAVLSLPADPNRRIWLIADELPAIGKIQSLEAALNMGRKAGLCVVAGVQSIFQLDRVYGKDSASVLRSCFRNLAVLGLSKTDPDTAEAMSRALGDQEVSRAQSSRSDGLQGVTHGTSMQRVRERLLLPSELTSLPDLTGYLALAGDRPISKIQLKPQDLDTVVKPFMER